MRKNGFTLIELLAVIVILGVLALITVPIVLKLVNNARRDAAIRSAESYIEGVKKAIVTNKGTIYSECKIQEEDGNLLCDGEDKLEIDVSGKRPTSGTINFNAGEVSDVDSIRFGKYYISGEITSLVAITKSLEVERKEGEYLVGDKVTYNNERYYVIKKSEPEDSTLTLLKMFPLTKDEVIAYGVGADGENRAYQYVNGERDSNVRDSGGYGVVPWDSGYRCEHGYYCTNGNCGFTEMFSGCAKVYDKAGIKVIVDNWAKENLSNKDLVKVDGYKVRLLSTEDALGDLKYSTEGSGTASYSKSSRTPTWATGNKYNFWLMDLDEDMKNCANLIGGGYIGYRRVNAMDGGTVRPVINVKKSVIDHPEESTDDDNPEEDTDIESSTICKSLSNDRSTIPGTKYSCEVKAGTRYNFYILTNESGKVNLIMDRNICEDGTPATKTNRCLYSWYNNSVDNRYGPTTALEKLYNATKTWYKIPYTSIDYEDEAGKIASRDYGYKKVVSTESQITIYDRYNNITKTISTQDQPVRAHLPKFSELITVCAYNQSNSCPSWMVGNLKSLDINGYWSMSAYKDNYYDAYLVRSYATIDRIGTNYSEIGIRPVITLSLTDLS